MGCISVTVSYAADKPPAIYISLQNRIGISLLTSYLIDIFINAELLVQMHSSGEVTRDAQKGEELFSCHPNDIVPSYWTPSDHF